MLAQREQGGALGLLRGRELFPLRAADGTEEDGVRGGADLQRGLRQGAAVAVDGGAANVGRGGLKREVFLAGDDREDAQRLGHDFGSDVVSGEDGELEGGHKG